MCSFPHRIVTVAAVLAGAAVITPAAADAAQVAQRGATLHYTAAPGENNDLAVSTSANRIVFEERGGVRIAPTCGARAPAAQLSCSLAGIRTIHINVSDGENVVDSSLAGRAITAYSITAAAASTANDLRHTGALAVAMTGGDGADRLATGEGADALDGGQGDDQLLPFVGADRVDGGPGSDVASYAGRLGSVTVTLDGTANDGAAGEKANILPTNEEVVGGSRSDLIVGSAASERLTGGPGADTIRGGFGADTVGGDAGDDDLFGGGDGDLVLGGPGDDDVLGEAGNDQLLGGADRDLFEGGDGDDRAQGEAGDDLMRGGRGRDTLTGGDGDDRLIPDADADEAIGNAGTDLVDYSDRAAAVTVDLDGAADDGEAGELDRVDPSIESIAGGTGDDALTGGTGSNEIFGLDGADRIDAGIGEDRVFAMDGNDTVQAQDLHQDVVDCGQGADLLAADPNDLLTGCDPEAEPDKPGGGPVVGNPIAPRSSPDVRITPQRARVAADGTVSLQVSCSPKARRSCSGELALGKASATFKAAAGERTRVHIRLRAADRRRLARRGVLRLTAGADVVDTAETAWTVSQRVVLRRA